MDLATTNLDSATIKGIEIKEKVGVMVELPEDFSEVDIFSLLLEKFGRPNGFMTYLSKYPNGDPDSPWKWDFMKFKGTAIINTIIGCPGNILLFCS